MKRNLKALLLTAMAVGVLGAIGAAGAQATAFECAGGACTITATKDIGTDPATGHHVIDIPGNWSLTCNEMTFDTKNQPVSSTFLTLEKIQYHGCPILGQPIAISMNGCDYRLDAHGGMQIICTPGTNKISLSVPGCAVTIGSQSLTGVKDSSLVGLTQTISINVEKIAGEAHGALCITAGPFTTGRITTGNTLITGASAGGTMVAVKWNTTK